VTEARDTLESSVVDLHCHTSASFDCLVTPPSLVQAAAERGITHLAITDHDCIDGALAAREAAPPGLSIIIGEEINTLDGDLIALFLHEAIPPGLSALATIEAIRRQDGLVGIPHPFDRSRRSVGRHGTVGIEPLAALVDFVETFNARVARRALNGRAAEFARRYGLPGVAVSDAHTILEVGIASTALPGRITSAADLRLALTGAGRENTAQESPWSARGLPLRRLASRLRGRGSSGRT
jgi:predicted metal-dependent phosphoesterase TrpH